MQDRMTQRRSKHTFLVSLQLSLDNHQWTQELYTSGRERYKRPVVTFQLHLIQGLNLRYTDKFSTEKYMAHFLKGT